MPRIAVFSFSVKGNHFTLLYYSDLSLEFYLLVNLELCQYYTTTG